MADKQDIILKELLIIKKDVKEIKVWQQKTDDRFDSIELNQERHEKMITQLLQIVGATNAKVVKLENRTDKLEETVSELIVNTTRIAETVGMIAQRMEKQNDFIEKLTARSIQQEQEIRELQRIKSA
jgi:methyl-accepting chemotaxis protein